MLGVEKFICKVETELLLEIHLSSECDNGLVATPQFILLSDWNDFLSQCKFL